jgi:hypothetical protein
MVVRRLPFLFLSLFAMAAPAAHAQRAWQAPVPLGLTAEHLVSAVAADGEVLLAWTENPQSGAAWRLRALAGATPVTLTERSSHIFSVAAAADGSAVIAWTDSPADYGGTPRVFAAFRPAGGAFEAPVELGSGAWALPVVVAANARGDFAVAFNDTTRLMLARRPAGGAFLPAVAVDPLGTSSSHALAVAPDGEPIVAWVRQAGVSSTTYTLHATTGTLVDEVLHGVALSTPSDAFPFPSLAVDGQGRAIVGWAERPPGAANGSVRVATRTAPGLWSDPIVLDDGVRSAPVLGVSDGGDVVAAWTTFVASDASGSGAPGPVRVSTGQLATGAFDRPREHSISTQPPDVAVNPDGTAIVSYGDWNYEMHTVRREGLAPFGPIQTVTCPAPHATPLLAGLDAGGTATLFYRAANSPLSPWAMVRDAPAAAASPSGCQIGPTLPQGPRRAPDVIVSSIKVPRGQKLGTVLRRGLRVTTNVNADGPSSAIGLWLKGKRLAVARYRQVADVPVTTTLVLPRSAARKLRKARRVKVSLVLTRGGAALKTLRLTLKR